MTDDSNDPKPAHDCRSMSDVRQGIDHIDRQLVQLIAQRQSYIEAAGRIKPRREDVHNQARIDDVVRKVVLEAARCGLQERIAEPVWRELINRSIDYEYIIWDSAHAQSKKEDQ